MKNCFVSMPYGKKPDYRTGAVFDFERLYNKVIKPAVEDSGIYCFKDFEMVITGDINRQILSAVINADIMIADITTSNPNVFYELGVRHALRNETTILIMEKNSYIPSYANYLKILIYDYDAVLNGDDGFRNILISELKRSIEYKSVDSPLYQIFQGLHVELPEDLEAMKAIRMQLQADKKEDEYVLAQINFLKELQRNANYSELIKTAENLPVTLQKHPEIRQLWAMALTKRRNPGDFDCAIEFMQDLIDETGGDSESYSILGSVYRHRYQQQRNIADLDSAIVALGKSYDLQPNDYYTGVNLLFLLFQRDSPESTSEFKRLSPEIKKTVEDQLEDGKGDFWSYSKAIELACLATDWDKANYYIDALLTTATSQWMLMSLVEQFVKILSVLKNKEDKEKLNIIIDRLNIRSLKEEHRNA